MSTRTNAPKGKKPVTNPLGHVLSDEEQDTPAATLSEAGDELHDLRTQLSALQAKQASQAQQLNKLEQLMSQMLEKLESRDSLSPPAPPMFSNQQRPTSSNPDKVRDARFAYRHLMMQSNQSFADFQTTFLHLAGEGQAPTDNLRMDLFDKLTTPLQERLVALLIDLDTYEKLAARCLAVDSELKRISTRVDREKRLIS
jgi:hypothetical protein